MSEYLMKDPIFIKYYKEEWGKLVVDDKKLFEFLVLEIVQAGLSWITALKRRENYRKAFLNYDLSKITKFTEKNVENLMSNEGLIRNKKKLEAIINNAQKFIDVQKEFGNFSNYIRTFLPNGQPPKNTYKDFCQVPAKNDISDKMSQDMKKRGFKFFGSIMCYSFLQSSGYIEDEILSFKNKY